MCPVLILNGHNRETVHSILCYSEFWGTSSTSKDLWVIQWGRQSQRRENTISEQSSWTGRLTIAFVDCKKIASFRTVS